MNTTRSKMYAKKQRLRTWWHKFPLHVRITATMSAVMAIGLSACSIVTYVICANVLEGRMKPRIMELSVDPYGNAFVNQFTPPQFLAQSQNTNNGDMQAFGNQLAQHAGNELQETLLLYLIITTAIIVVLGGLVAYFVSKSALTDIKFGQQRLENFVSDASHELRTPLAVVKGQAELYKLKSASGDKSGADEAMQKITLAASRMENLVNDLLILTRGESSTQVKSSTDLREVLDEVLTDMTEFKDRHPVNIVLDSQNLPEVRIVSEQFYRVFANLFTNIDKYTPDNTPVDVRFSRTGSHLRVDVSDHGPGVDWKQRDLIYQRFYTSAESRNRELSGNGLGLSIVRQIIQAHKGTISASETSGGGLTHTIIV